MSIFKNRRLETTKELSWYNVPIYKYLKAEKALNEPDEDELSRALAALYELKGIDYSNVPLNEYMEAVKELEFMKVEVPKEKVPNEIILNGRKYRIKKGIDKITTAQFIDFTNYSKREDFDKIIYILSCFIVPEGKDYGSDYELDEVIEDIKTMPVVWAVNICFFFERQCIKLWKNFRNYLTYQVLKMPLPMKKKINLWKLLSAASLFTELSHTY